MYRKITALPGTIGHFHNPATGCFSAPVICFYVDIDSNIVIAVDFATSGEDSQQMFASFGATDETSVISIDICAHVCNELPPSCNAQWQPMVAESWKMPAHAFIAAWEAACSK